MVSGEDRGVAPVIGFILVFSFLIIAFSIYQGVVIPDQNRKAEFQHSERVQGELLDLQDAIRRTGTTGVGQSVPIRVGADYPDRTLGVNFAVSGGRVSTVRPNASGPNNITFENVEAARSEVRDYWNSSAPDSTLAFPTKDIVFRPSYTRYTNAPDTVLSNTGVFNQFENANISLANQIMIQDDRITIVAINGSLDKGKSGEGASVSVDTQPLSVATNSITIRNNSEGPMNLTVPTTVANESVWNDSGLLDQSQLRSGGVSASGSELTIPLKNDTYTLRMAKVGVGSDTEDEGAEYIVPVESPPRTVFNDTSHQVTVEVRDRFNNPNSSTEVDASVVGTGGGSIAPTDGNGETDSQGEVTFNYTAPGGSGEDTLVFNISGDPAGTADERKIVNHSVTVVKSTSGGGTSGGDDGTGYDTEWYSPADLGPGTNANGELSSCSETDCTYDVGLDPTDDNVTLRAVIDLSAVGGLGVDFGVNDSSVAEPFPSENDTDSNSNATTVLNTTSDGTVAVYAVSGGSYDRINLSVISTPVVTDVTIGDDTDGNGIVTDGDTVEITTKVTDRPSITSVQADASAFGAGTVTLADAGPNSTAADDFYSTTFQVGGSATEGSQSVTVNATDDAGNGGAQNVASGTLTVDTTPPSVSSVTIGDDTDGNGIVTDGDTVEITATVTDATAITSVQADASAFDAGTVTLADAGPNSTAADDEYSAVVTVGAGVTDGERSVTVSATDEAGNGGAQNVASGTLTVDTTPPSVSSVTIGDDTDGNGIVTDGDAVEITATVTDATAITSVQADASAFDAGTVTLADAGPNSTAADDEYSAVVTVGAGVTDGARSVTVSATDEAGNGGAQNVASGTLTVDTTAPSIADPTPADGASGVDNATRYTVNVTDATSGVDESSITVTVEDSSGVILNSVGTGNADVTFFGANETLEIEAPAADYADGQVNVTVDAADNAGNAAPQFTSNFTVGATQAGQIQLSGAATAAGGSGKYEFDVTNTGSLDAEIVAVAINDTSNPNVVEVNNNKDILVANSTEIIDQPIPIDSSTPDGTRVNVKPGETPFVISKNGATATLEFNRFQDSGGQNVAMGGETVNTTFFFSDGSKATVTIN